VYERDRAEPWSQHPDKVAVRTNFYSFKEKGGSYNDSVEELLGMAESAAMPVIKKLASEQCEPTPEERMAVGWFMGLQEFRVPGIRDQLDDGYINMIKQTLKVAAEVPGYLERIDAEVREKEGAHATAETTEEFREWIRNGFKGYELSVEASSSLSTMLKLASRLAPYYARMNWTIFRMPDSDSLITSDNPVLKRNTNPDKSNLYGHLLGITNRFIEVWLPLSRRALLVVDHDFDRFEKCADLFEKGREAEAKEILRSAVPKTTFDSLPAGRATQVRRMIIQNAYKYVFSPARDQFVEEYAKGPSMAPTWG
jgi:hypothetical protein